MKNAVIGFILLAMLIMSGAAINTINTKNMRQNELDSNLNQAIKKSLEILKVDASVPMTDKELAADAMEGVLQGVRSDSRCTFQVKRADAQKGVLDMEVTEHYKQVLGQGSVSAKRGTVSDDWTNDNDIFYTITFQDGREKIKEAKCKARHHLTADMLPGNGEGTWQLDVNGRSYTKDTISNVVTIGNLVFKVVK